jgi:hypothetical protein
MIVKRGLFVQGEPRKGQGSEVIGVNMIKVIYMRIQKDIKPSKF